MILGLLALPGGRVDAQVAVDVLERHIVLGRDPLSQVIGVRNETDSVQQVQVSVQDWERDSLGNNVFVDLGTLDASCGDRLEVFPRTLQIGPQRTENLRVTYRPTGVSDEGCWGIVMIEPVRPPITATGARSTAVITVLTGVKIYVRRSDATIAGTIEFADVEASWLPAAAGKPAADSTMVQDVVVRFVSTGTDHMRLTSVFEIRDDRTQLVARINGPVAYLTPGAFRDLLVRVPELPRGRYVAVVLVDFGDDEVQAAQVEFEVP
ncbi:MAG: hypothetical protein WD771_07940 [Gemmatimonadaceae bacterium]